MALKWNVRLINRLYASWSFLLSFRKRDWELNDYPIRARLQASDPRYSASRFKMLPHVAYVVGWAGLSGQGETRQEAIDDLNLNFQKVKLHKTQNGEPLPRPGTKVPIEFAPQEKINPHAELAEEFTQRVLGFEWVWMSDESSLWDFHEDETNQLLYSKIQEVYGVDVSDIESAKVSEILDRIAASNRWLERSSKIGPLIS